VPFDLWIIWQAAESVELQFADLVATVSCGAQQKLNKLLLHASVNRIVGD
jgi:hypothetical protein